jgi:hypothetical protein
VENLAAQAAPLCLRCRNIRTRYLEGWSQNITFFECPSCHRQYARDKSGTLTFRWPHPISLALNCVLFSENPIAEAPRVAKLLASKPSSLAVDAMAGEIELELEQPTQDVRNIVNNPQSEEVCRQFLADVARQLREQFAGL